MIVGIDGSSLLHQPTGVGKATDFLLRSLQLQDDTTTYRLWCNAYRQDQTLALPALDERFTVRKTRVPGKVLMGWWKRFSWPNVQSFAGKIDVFHSPNYYYHQAGKAACVASIYDLSFMRDSEYGERFGGAFFRETLPQFLPKLHRIIVPSKATLEDFEMFFPQYREKVRLIPLAVPFEETVASETTTATLRKHHLEPQGYGIAIGTLEPRKHYPLMLEAFAKALPQLPESWKLLIVGKEGWQAEAIFATVERLKLRERVLFPGYVSDEELRALLAGAGWYCSTSRLEGFGLPFLDALNQGVPCVVPGIGAYQETGGAEYSYCEPEAAEFFTAMMTRLSTDGEARQRLGNLGKERAATFSLKEMGAQTLQVYREAYEDSH